MPAARCVVTIRHRGRPALGRRHERRVEEASRFIDVDQLCLSPQCGFASTQEGNALSHDQQVAKLELIVETAREIWD